MSDICIQAVISISRSTRIAHSLKACSRKKFWRRMAGAQRSRDVPTAMCMTGPLINCFFSLELACCGRDASCCSLFQLTAKMLLAALRASRIAPQDLLAAGARAVLSYLPYQCVVISVCHQYAFSRSSWPQTIPTSTVITPATETGQAHCHQHINRGQAVMTP